MNPRTKPLIHIPVAERPKPPFTGAAAGIVDPGHLAKKLKLKIHGAWLTCWMLRVFGPPNCGSDPHKNLCTWSLTTPMRGLYLSVTPYMGDDGEDDHPHSHTLSFGYLATCALEQRASTAPAAEQQPYRKFKERCLQWAKKKGGVAVVPEAEAADRERISRFPFKNKDAVPLILVWAKPGDPWSIRPTLRQLRTNRFYWLRLDIMQAWRNEHPKAKTPRRPRENRVLVREMEKALTATLRAFKFPVFVRDIPFSPAGRTEDFPKMAAATYEHAGYAMAMPAAPKTKARRCRVCGCTQDDCHHCITRTGKPCSWVAKDLCSACA